MTVSIIIVNWNSREYLRRCLSSIRSQPTKIEYEVIVIDSGSFDGCEQMLKEEFPWVRFIQSHSNMGFAGCNNHAFSEARGEYVLFLNPDTELVGPVIDILYSYAATIPECGGLGCRLLNADGTVQSSCIQAIPTILNQCLDSEYLRAKWPRSRLWGVASLFDQGQGPHEVEAVSGACVMVKRSTFAKVGRFNERYFMYSEDIDLSYRLRKAGYKNYFASEASVVHYGGGSSNQAVSAFAAVMMREATWLFLRATRGELYAWGYRIGMLVSAVGRIVASTAALLYESVGPIRTARLASLRKWVSVLRWSLRLDNIVRRYYPEHSALLRSRPS